MKIITVVGARPQFIKAGVVSRQIRDNNSLKEQVIHTGQHFDSNMSSIFFDQLGMPKPDFQLSINGGSHGDMTGRMLIEIEEIFLKEKPDMVLVYGDTNSTLAGALAAAKLHIPVSHVEAGLRSHNMKMPEEINRILTDQISNILFCPTKVAVDNLNREGFQNKGAEIYNVGDVMQDSAMLFSQYAQRPNDTGFNDDFILATIHRAENTDDPERLRDIISALNDLNRNFAQVVLPLHPRTKSTIEKLGIKLEVKVIDPVGYLEMLWLLKASKLVLTDSGGVQKEAFFFGKPCVTMRDQTEWVELIEVGANTLVGANKNEIIEVSRQNFGREIVDDYNLYGGGKASASIVDILSKI